MDTGRQPVKQQPQRILPLHQTHHPHPNQQGLPPPQHLQHPRPGVVQHQQHHPDSPHQPQPAQAPNQGPYASPHPSNPGIPQQHQSPYVGSVPGHSGQQQQELPYFAQHSPYSANSAAGSYSSSDPPDLGMAATMNRPSFPPIYHTPQSNSPASVQSPPHDQHGRPIYGQPPTQMPQSMYPYPPYQMQQSPAYGQHQPQQHGQMQTSPMMIKYEQQQPMQPQGSHPHTPGMPQSPRSKMSQTPGLQRPPSNLGPPQGPPAGPPGSAPMHPGAPGAAGVNPNAAPGPIPATTPLVVRQDQNGVQWIAFEYSRDRVKMEYTIRCDVESVNVDELPQEFKTENCVYPRACCPKDQYKGNRLHYETECNTVGWALAQLNPCLRGKRGLIQRAVDSWRNSNQDPRLRSRRVRRQAKIETRKGQQPRPGAHMTAPGGPVSAGVPNSAGLAAGPGPGARQPANIGMGPQLHHHHEHPTGPPGATEDVSAPNGHGTGSPNDVRQAQNFYPTYPTGQNVAGGPPGGAMPRLHHDGIEHVGAHAQPHAAQPVSKSKRDEEKRNIALFGDLPEDKRRKFILVDDTQRGARVRVRVMLDQVQMEEMPDSYRKSNSVFPRSYFPTQMQSPPLTPRGSRFFTADADDEDNDVVAAAAAAIAAEQQEGGVSGTAPTRGRTVVPVAMVDGSEVKVPQPRMNKTRRGKEVTLNDLGYRMSWSQSRVFSGRTLFLQRSLDAYRNKMRSTMVAAGQDVSTVAPHFETRVGKRKLLERRKRAKRDVSP